MAHAPLHIWPGVKDEWRWVGEGEEDEPPSPPIRNERPLTLEDYLRPIGLLWRGEEHLPGPPNTSPAFYSGRESGNVL
jgi:hypothetical protein